MKRQAFKALIAANRRLRRKRPALRLVVSNPPPVAVNFARRPIMLLELPVVR